MEKTKKRKKDSRRINGKKGSQKINENDLLVFLCLYTVAEI